LFYVIREFHHFLKALFPLKGRTNRKVMGEGWGKTKKNFRAREINFKNNSCLGETPPAIPFRKAKGVEKTIVHAKNVPPPSICHYFSNGAPLMIFECNKT